MTTDEHVIDLGISILLQTVGILGWEFYRVYTKSKLLEKAYWGERRGRARVEQEIRNLTQINLNTSEGFFVQPIGTIESCYKQCIGTPRQGLLVPNSRAFVTLANNISPEALDGLDDFSHVWLTFQFHLNSNVLKEAKAYSGVLPNSRRYTFTAKVVPPMLKKRKGVLSTRSPHRPNPIGVTLARLDYVCKASRTIVLGGCDLVHGTPVLDIKPYVHTYDSIPEGQSRIPNWISETIYTRNIVTISEIAKVQARELCYLMSIYRDDFLHQINNLHKRQISDLPPTKRLKRIWIEGEISFWTALSETLAADVRSEFQTKRAIEIGILDSFSELPFDGVIIRYKWLDKRSLEVIEVVKAPTEIKAFSLTDDKNNHDNMNIVEVDVEVDEEEGDVE